MGVFSVVKGAWTIAVSLGRTKNNADKAQRVDFLPNGRVAKVSDYACPEQDEEPKYKLIEEKRW